MLLSIPTKMVTTRNEIQLWRQHFVMCVNVKDYNFVVQEINPTSLIKCVYSSTLWLAAFLKMTHIAFRLTCSLQIIFALHGTHFLSIATKMAATRNHVTVKLWHHHFLCHYGLYINCFKWYHTGDVIFCPFRWENKCVLTTDHHTQTYMLLIRIRKNHKIFIWPKYIYTVVYNESYEYRGQGWLLLWPVKGRYHKSHLPFYNISENST